MLTCSLKWWDLIDMCLVSCVYLGYLANSRASLSSKMDDWVTGNFELIFKTFTYSPKMPINGIKSLILWLSTIYSASVVDNMISVYILLMQSTGKIMYIIILPVLDNADDFSCTISWLKNVPAKLASTYSWECLFRRILRRSLHCECS